MAKRSDFGYGLALCASCHWKPIMNRGCSKCFVRLCFRCFPGHNCGECHTKERPVLLRDAAAFGASPTKNLDAPFMTFDRTEVLHDSASSYGSSIDVSPFGSFAPMHCQETDVSPTCKCEAIRRDSATSVQCCEKLPVRSSDARVERSDSAASLPAARTLSRVSSADTVCVGRRLSRTQLLFGLDDSPADGLSNIGGDSAIFGVQMMDVQTDGIEAHNQSQRVLELERELDVQRDESQVWSKVSRISESARREFVVRATQRIEQLESQLAGRVLDAQLSHRDQVVSHESPLNALRGAAANAERDHARVRADLEERINLMETRNQRLQNEVEGERKESERRCNAREPANEISRALEVELEMQHKAAALEKERATQRPAQLEEQRDRLELNSQLSHREQAVAHESSLNALQTAAANANREHSTAIIDDQERISTAERRNQELQRKLAVQREEINDLSNAREVAEARNGELEIQLEGNTMDALCDRENVAQRIAQLEGELGTLREAVQDAEAKALSHASAQILSSEVRRQGLEKDINTLREQLVVAISASVDGSLSAEPLHPAQKSVPTPRRVVIPPLHMSQVGTTTSTASTKSGQSIQSHSSGSTPSTPNALFPVGPSVKKEVVRLAAPRPMEATRSQQTPRLSPRPALSQSPRSALPEARHIAEMVSRPSPTSHTRPPLQLQRQPHVHPSAGVPKRPHDVLTREELAAMVSQRMQDNRYTLGRADLGQVAVDPATCGHELPDDGLYAV
jgi:hypothetical protein